MPERRAWGTGWVATVPCMDGLEATASIDFAEWCALTLWIDVATTLDWRRAELWWRLISACEHPLVWEMHGNEAAIWFVLRYHRADYHTVREACAAVYPAMAFNNEACAWWRHAAIRALGEVASPWSVASITQAEHLPDSPLWACVEWLLSLPAAVTGFFQCIAQPAALTDVWHREIELQHDLAFLRRLVLPPSAVQRSVQQVPSGDLRARSAALEKKAAGTLPFFGVVLRCGIAATIDATFRLPTWLRTYRCDGRALDLTPLEVPPGHVLDHYFGAAACPSSGLVLNSAELALLAHVLPARPEVSARTVWPSSQQEVAPTCTVGAVVGSASVTGVSVPVAIPADVRARGTHVVSAAGMGKSTLLKHLFLQDISNGGAAFIDPHGDAVHDLMALLPPEARERCIYFNPADSEFTPRWNPLTVPAGSDPYRVADDLLDALERVSSDWGDRLATVLRHALVGLLHLPGSTMHDLYNVVRQRSPESDALRARIIAACPDRAVRQFWSRDFLKSYREADLAAPRHKLLKLVSGGAVSRMLSQPESRIDIRKVMDGGGILLVDLAGLGAETREFLGSFLLTLVVIAAMGRSTVVREQRKPFSVFADEAHLFAGGRSFESLLAQARKFRVNVVLAHQYLRQFSTSTVDALLTAGTTLVGRVDRSDAAILAKDFQGKITADDISQLRPFEMVGRIGTDIVRFQTPAANDRADPQAVSEIISSSRVRFYLPRESVVTSGSNAKSPYEGVDLSFDEF